MANTKKRWTADEIEILRKYYPAEGDQVCERLSGRTAKSCRIQASKMEISKNISSSATVQNDVKYVRLWTEAEDKILREYYAAEGSKVRYRLNQRSAESCRGRAAALGLTYSGANRKWSSSEDKILRNYYPTEGAEVQKRLEGRSKEACNKRAAKLGLCILGRKEWTAEEDEIIRTYYKAEGRKAAERLEGRTLTACQSRAKYLNVRSDNNRLPWTQEEDAIISRYYEEKGAGYVHTLIPERSLQACKYRAMILGLSRKTNDPWTKAEEKILKKYYPVEGGNVYKRLNNRTRNACISKAAQLHLQYGLHLRLECDETGKFRVYEDSVLLDEKEYDRQQIENLADTMGLQIERNKITLDSSEKEIEDDIFRLIAGCYLIYFLHYFMKAKKTDDRMHDYF